MAGDEWEEARNLLPAYYVALELTGWVAAVYTALEIMSQSFQVPFCLYRPALPSPRKKSSRAIVLRIKTKRSPDDRMALSLAKKGKCRPFFSSVEPLSSLEINQN